MSHADRTNSSRLPADRRPRAGRLGRLGRWSARRLRVVAAIWAAVFIALVALAPQTEHALSGGGWKADGSESSQARTLIDRHFDGAGAYGLSVAVHSSTHTVDAPGFRATLRRVRGVLEREPAVRFASANSVSVSADRRTAVVRAGAAGDDAEMVRAAGRLRARLEGVGSPGVDVLLTGSPAIWSEFNTANKAAMLRSELMSWPLTLAVLVLAFGSVAAAGLPLLLSVLGLVATAGTLWIGAQATDISIWAMNFALMFALAVGIDYALLIVVRFRAALRSGLTPPDAIEVTMDTAGRAVLLSGVAVLASLLAMMVVPSQPFRTSALGILLAVTFVLAASLTILPAILAHLGVRVDRLALPWRGAIQHRSEAFARWARRIWARPIRLGVIALALLVPLAVPATQLRTAMPSVGVLPDDATARAGYAHLQVGSVGERDRDRDDAVGLAAGVLELPPAGVQSALRAPRDVDDLSRLAALAALELRGTIPEPQACRPRPVPSRPRVGGPLVVDLAAQQELPQPVAGAHQIGADVLPAAHQIAQLLVLDRRDRDQRQLAGGQPPGEPDRVALVGLDAVRRVTVAAPGSAHQHLDPLRPRATRQPVAGRRFVDHPRRRLDPAQPRQQLVRTTDDPARGHLARGLVEDRHRDLVGMHVQTDPADCRGRPSSRSATPRGGRRAPAVRRRGGRGHARRGAPTARGARRAPARRRPSHRA